jgi:hypothetical protein
MTARRKRVEYPAGMIEHQFSRKRFVAGAGLGVASLALPAVASATSHKQLAVFRLNPDAGVSDGPGAACACKACYGHTAKLFRSTEAADANRAHPYCNCGIERAGTIPMASGWPSSESRATSCAAAPISATPESRRSSSTLRSPPSRSS